MQLPDGVEFSVGTGLSDSERENPPAAGSIITFRYQELSDGGVPRFPSYVRVRQAARAASASSVSVNKEPSNPKAKPVVGSARRYEYVDGGSSKFWETELRGSELITRFGRLGTDGQEKIKALPDAATAAKEQAKLIKEKLRKGYQEV